MRRFALLAVLALGCQQVPSPEAVSVGIGGTANLAAAAAQALGCSTALQWAVLEAGGGTVDQAGNYLAPSCGVVGVPVQGLYHVTASGCSKTVSIPIAVVEDLVSVAIVCAVIAPATTCAPEPIEVPPGGHVQFYAKLTYTCGDFLYSPSPPPGF